METCTIIILNENRPNQINALYNEKNAHIDPREASEAKPRRPRGGQYKHFSKLYNAFMRFGLFELSIKFYL